MSLPEVLLWREFQRQDRVKFRRQHPLGEYVLDFYCAKAKVCIKIDGIVHDMGNRPVRDGVRDDWLRGQGIEVMRVLATDVFESPEEMAERLVRYCSR